MSYTGLCSDYIHTCTCTSWYSFTHSTITSLYERVHDNIVLRGEHVLTAWVYIYVGESMNSVSAQWLPSSCDTSLMTLVYMVTHDPLVTRCEWIAISYIRILLAVYS